MLRHSSSSPIYTAIARLTRLNSNRLLSPAAPSRKTSSRSRANTTPLLILILLLLLLLILVVSAVFLLPATTMSSSAPTAPFENPRAVVRKLLSEAQSEGHGATVRRSIGRYSTVHHPSLTEFCECRWLTSVCFLLLQARAQEPGPIPHARRVFGIQARRIPRPPPPRIRDRDLHARRGLHPPGLLRTQGHHQNGRCSVDDGRPRHRALRDAGVGRRAEGPAALDQPRLQGQDDRAAVPGAGEQGHKPRGEGRRGGPDHRGGGLRGAVAGVHADADHVHGLHDAAGVAAPPAGPGGLERIRVRDRGGGRVRPGGRRAGGRAPLPRARRRRGRAQRVERVRRAAAVRAGGGAAAEGAGGAAGAVRDEHARGDPAGHGGLLLRPQRLRESRPLELRLNLSNQTLLQILPTISLITYVYLCSLLFLLIYFFSCLWLTL